MKNPNQNEYLMKIVGDGFTSLNRCVVCKIEPMDNPEIIMFIEGNARSFCSTRCLSVLVLATILDIANYGKEELDEFEIMNIKSMLRKWGHDVEKEI